MKRIQIVFIVFALIAGIHGNATAYLSRFLDVNTNSREWQLLKHPSEFSLLEGGLIASGIASPFRVQYANQISNAIKEIKVSTGQTTDRKKAQAVFDFMHKKILKNYKKSATTLDLALRDGTYNCLSSTLLYNILLESVGIDAKAVVLPTHVYTIIKIKGQTIEVENTTPLGFDVLSNKIAQQALKRLTGYNYGDIGKFREIVGNKGLVAYTYANRASFEDKAGQYQAAFQDALKSYAIFPQGTYIYTNVAAAFVNYSAYLNNTAHEYDKALAVLEEAMTHFPVEKDFINNYLAAAELAIQKDVKNGRYEKSFKLIEKARHFSKRPLTALENRLYQNVILTIIRNDGDFKKAYVYAVRAVKLPHRSPELRDVLVDGFNRLSQRLSADGYKPDEEKLFLKWYALMRNNNFDTILENLYSLRAKSLYEKGKTDQALSMIDKGLSYQPASKMLKGNGAYIAGNTAVSYLKKKQFAKGLVYLKLALKYNPSDAATKNNLVMAYREWAYGYIEKRQYAKALKIVNQGLLEVPEDHKLQYYRDYLHRKLK